MLAGSGSSVVSRALEGLETHFKSLDFGKLKLHLKKPVAVKVAGVKIPHSLFPVFSTDKVMRSTAIKSTMPPVLRSSVG